MLHMCAHMSCLVDACGGGKSVQDLAHRLMTARNIVVVGNGGIALELVHTVS